MAVNENLAVLLKSSGIGDAEPDLGEKLMKAFLTTLLESGDAPAKIICMNSAVFLTTEGSQVLDVLAKFEEAGTKILSCGTCLDYYGRKEKLKAGEPTNMKDTVDTLLHFGRVIAL